MESNLLMTEPGDSGSIWNIWRDPTDSYACPRRLDSDGNWVGRKGESRVKISIIHLWYRPMETSDMLSAYVWNRQKTISSSMEGVMEGVISKLKRKKRSLTRSTPFWTDGHDAFLQFDRVAYTCIDHPGMPQFASIPSRWTITGGCKIPQIMVCDKPGSTVEIRSLGIRKR